MMVPTLSKLETSLKGSPFPVQIQTLVFQNAIDTVRRFHEMGGEVALGTDTIVRWGNPVGMPVREMELLLEAGLSMMEVLKAGTRLAARVCGGEAELGTLETGKYADLIVVNGDPLADVGVFDEIVGVVISGDVV